MGPYKFSDYRGVLLPPNVTTLITSNSDYLKCFDQLPITINTICFEQTCAHTLSYTNFDVSTYLHVYNYHFTCYTNYNDYVINFNNVNDYNSHIQSLHDKFLYNNTNIFDTKHVNCDLFKICGKLPYDSLITFHMVANHIF